MLAADGRQNSKKEIFNEKPSREKDAYNVI